MTDSHGIYVVITRYKASYYGCELDSRVLTFRLALTDHVFISRFEKYVLHVKVQHFVRRIWMCRTFIKLCTVFCGTIIFLPIWKNFNFGCRLLADNEYNDYKDKDTICIIIVWSLFIKLIFKSFGINDVFKHTDFYRIFDTLTYYP